MELCNTRSEEIRLTSYLFILIRWKSANVLNKVLFLGKKKKKKKKKKKPEGSENWDKQ